MFKNILSMPVLAMAFRPFYTLASLFGAFAILLWGFGFQGNEALPGFFWHAHEMIWGYAGAIIVGFLLTAVATWTGQLPTRGGALLLLVCLWLISRVSIYLPYGLLCSSISGVLFYGASVICFAHPIVKTRNTRNYLPIFALAVFGLTQLAFDLALLTGYGEYLLTALYAGMVMVACFMTLVGSRVIPFFTSKRLGIPQVGTPTWMMKAILFLPLILVFLLFVPLSDLLITIVSMIYGFLCVLQVSRWWDKKVLTEPLLWVLFIAYLSTGLGLMCFGLSVVYAPEYKSLGVHLITVGGIGMMTLGMMSRTALGHTGRMMKLVSPMPSAFYLMCVALVLRTAANLGPGPIWYHACIGLSSVVFASSLLLFAYRYVPWLIKPRIDGRPG